MRVLIYVNFLLLLTLFFFVNETIAVVEDTASTVVIQHELKTYYDRFFEIYDEECVPSKRVDMPKSLTVRLSKNDAEMENDKHIGLCYFDIDHDPNKRLILIKKSWFSRVDDDLRFGVVFHELTHCVLDQEVHDSDPDDYFSPVLPVHTKKEYEKQLRSKIIRVCK